MSAELSGDPGKQGEFRLLIDSRTLTDPENSIFFALRTAHNDGHRYIPGLIEKGVSIFVTEKDYKEPVPSDVNILRVNDPRRALQELAAFHRKKFSLPVTGITGSNGKTIVKEWLLQLLTGHYRICSNPKSYNSQIGVPLSVWQLNASHDMALFEAGISTTGEMEHLERIIMPETGILTHLGTAHNEGFDDPAQKLSEKLRLFKNCKEVFMLRQPAVAAMLPCRVLTFGFSDPEADLNILSVHRKGEHTELEGMWQKETRIRFRIPFSDDASVENASLCALVCLRMGHFDAGRFEMLRPVSMRMELKKGIHRCLLVNDSYSNDLNALSTSLTFLAQQAVGKSLTAILSDIEESGLPAEILYPRVKRLLREKGIQRLIAVGPDFLTQKAVFENDLDCLFYADTAELLRDFYRIRFHEENILIKGARKFGFERIVKKLEQETHGTVLEINLSAIQHNLNAFKARLGPGMKIMAMVKAFAYGSGSYEVAKLLQDKVDYLAVAYADEGVALRKSGIVTPVMVMNADETAIEQITGYELEPVVFSVRQLQNLIAAAASQPIRIHIEMDTGMHRLGFSPEQVPEICRLISVDGNTGIASVFSHLSASDESQYDDFTRMQFSLFREAAEAIEKCVGHPVLKHISNTAAILRFKQEGLDMVRLGIGLYGIDPSGHSDIHLEPVFTLKTHISQIREVQQHESVGYSRKAISPEKRRIATLALGYADGLNRQLSNGNGGFYIRGKYAPIAGNVCMDMCMADVSGIECEEGDEAILFGRDHPIGDIAAKLHTIPYEVLTSISQRVKRVYVSE